MLDAIKAFLDFPLTIGTLVILISMKHIVAAVAHWVLDLAYHHTKKRMIKKAIMASVNRPGAEEELEKFLKSMGIEGVKVRREPPPPGDVN